MTFRRAGTKLAAANGHTHYASEHDQRYDIKNTKTDHIAVHEGHADP
jgi:hypothetical protein